MGPAAGRELPRTMVPGCRRTTLGYHGCDLGTLQRGRASRREAPTHTPRERPFRTLGSDRFGPAGSDRGTLAARALGRLGGLAAALALVRGDGDERGLDAALDGLLGHDALLDVAPGGQLELHLEQDLFDDRAQAPRPRLALEGLVRHGLQSIGREHELDPVEAEEALELLHDRVARLGQDRDEVVARELVDRRGDR